jgi:protein SCO1/2
MTRFSAILLGTVLAILLGMGTFALLGPGAPDQTPVAGTLFDTPRPIANFSLVDHTGQTFDHEHLKGRWSLVFFGFTQCEGLCPIRSCPLPRCNTAVGNRPKADIKYG